MVYPKDLSDDEKSSVADLLFKVQLFPTDKQQALLDELAGSINKNAITTNRIAFFSSLVDAAQKATFVPSRGLNVLSARSREVKTVTETSKNTEKLAISEYGKSLLGEKTRAALEKTQAHALSI